MEQFKKWLKENSRKTGYLYDETAERERRKGWQAALKEVLIQLNNIYDGDFENSDIVEWIKSELGDT